MKRIFTFTLKKEEYLSFLRYQSTHSKHAKGIRMWLRISLPALLVCLIVLMQLYDWFWLLAALFLVVIWEWLATSYLWKKYIYRTINEDTIRHMNIKNFQKVTVSFQDHKIMYKDSKPHEILYQDILRMSMADDIFIFQYKNKGTLLLPYRLFDGSEDIDEFSKSFKNIWEIHRNE